MTKRNVPGDLDILDSVADLIGIFDEDFRVVQANRAMREAFGGGEVVGARCYELFHGTDEPPPSCPFKAALESGEPAGTEICEAHLGGGWFAIDVFPLGNGAKGHRQAVHWVRDITERKQVEEALRLSQARLAGANEHLEGILEHTHMMAVSLDPEFNFVWVNRAYAETCGYEPSFFPGKNHFDLYPHEENQGIFQRVVDTGESFFAEAKPFEFPDQPERGVTYWDWSLIPVSDEAGEVSGLVFTLAEVTDRIRAELQLKESRDQLRELTARLDGVRGEERARFARELHDQVGQALTAMRWDLEMLEEELPEGQEAHSQRIRSMIDLTADAVDRVLRLSHELRSPVLDTLGIEAAIEAHAEEHRERSGVAIDLVQELHGLEPHTERDDVVLRIFQDALSNALLHAEAKRIDVRLRVVEGIVVLEVLDDGVGITDEQLQDHHSLGLIGMRERAVRLGGGVEIRRRDAGGTRVTARIPVAP